MNTKARSSLHSLGSGDDATPIACDVCYSRKIRCDRKTPCGNCVDSDALCKRQRPKVERKPRDVSLAETRDEMKEMKADIAALKTSMHYLISLSTKTTSVASNQGDPSRKRRFDAAFSETSSPKSTPSENHNYPMSARNESTPVSSYSALEASTLIQEELGQIPLLNDAKKAALHSALISLKQHLDTSRIEDQSPSAITSLPPLRDLSLPPITLMQWMLQSNDSGRSVSSDHFMPFISRKSIGEMIRKLLGNPISSSNLSSLICVASYAGYFVQEIVLSSPERFTGLEEHLRSQALDCFATARSAISSSLAMAPSHIENLQALTYSIDLAQENGDFVAAWLFTKHASKMCIDLNLHKKSTYNTELDPDAALEAYYLFCVCYRNDKGLAMNLSRPAFLNDSEIEIDIFKPPNSQFQVVDNHRIYLELAMVQSRLISSSSASGTEGGRRKDECLIEVLAKMDYIWELNRQLQKRPKERVKGTYDSQMEAAMVDFAFYAVKTVVLRSSGIRLKNSTYSRDCIEAARLALNAVQKTCELSKLSLYNNDYMKTSILSWTILYYPFTPFFILFCNVISTREMADYNTMERFVAYLDETSHINISAARLYKLCVPFLSIVSGIIISEGHAQDTPHTRQQQQAEPYHIPAAQPYYPQPTGFGDPLRSPRSQPQLQIWEPQSSQTVPADISSTGHIPIQQEGDLSSYDGGGGGGDLLADPSLWWFMDTQPVLQWLDLDLPTWDKDLVE